MWLGHWLQGPRKERPPASHEEVAMGLYDVRIVAKNRGDVQSLDEMRLDLHRRGTRREAIGRYLVPGLLTGEQIDQVKAAGFEVVVVDDVSQVPALRMAEVSKVNRFEKVTRAAEMAPLTVEGYLNVTEIETATRQIAEGYPELAALIELPNRTWDKRVSHAVRLGAGEDKDRIGVLFTGSMHAREWGGSDICIAFINSLVNAYESKLPLQFGTRVYAPEVVRLIVEKIWIYVFPCVNPDGKHYSQTVQTMWRKNRNPNGQAAPEFQGVDNNRNFGFLWNQDFGASAELHEDDYKGTAAFSEPETRNVKHLFDTYPDIRYYVDIHSWTGLILCSWGDDENQSTDPSQNFLNPAYDGKRGEKDGSVYREFISPSDNILSLGIGARMNEALAAVRGTQYDVQQGIDLYATTGTSSDYAYSRHILDPSNPKIMGFTIEFSKQGFIPPFSEMRTIIKEINAAMTELCWIAGADVLRP